MKKLIIATDHNGVEFKEELRNKLRRLKYKVIDASPENTPTDDYPDFAFRVGKMVLETEDSFGILVCGTGVGMCIAANKVNGIRCALVNSARAATLARADDDANVIALDSTMDIDFAVECVRLFAETKFKEEEKYHRRLNKVIDYENGAYNEL